MTPDPIEPTPNEEAPRVDGESAPVAWESDERSSGTWSADDEVPVAPKKEDVGPGKAIDDAMEDADDLAAAGRARPWRVSHIMIAVAVVAVVLWFVMLLGFFGLVLAPLGLVVLAITAGFVLARLRASRQEALLALLAIAAERGMPLDAAISAFADQFGGRSRRRILGVAAQLRAGRSLGLALSQPKRVVSSDAILMVRVGEAVDALPAAIRMTASNRAARVGNWTSFASQLAYLLALLSVAEAISSFLLYFIVPKFEAIFRDFGVPLPGITIFMIRISHLLVRYGGLAGLIVIGQVILLLYLPFSYGGWMNYRVPIFDRLMGRRHAALVLRAISLALEANRPIGKAMEILAADYPARWYRRRLARVSDDIDSGGDWIQALWRRGAIRRADAEVLGSAASVGNLSWACRELAATTERRQQLRMQMILQAIFPLAVLAVGLAVAVLCLGYFVPLVNLIQRLSDLP